MIMDRFNNYNEDAFLNDPNMQNQQPSEFIPQQFEDYTNLEQGYNYSNTEYNSTDYGNAEFDANAYNGFENSDYTNPSFDEESYNHLEFTNSDYSNTEFSSWEYSNSEFDTSEFNHTEYNKFEYELSENTSAGNTDMADNVIPADTAEPMGESIYSPLYPGGTVTGAPKDMTPSKTDSDYDPDELTDEEIIEMRRQRAIARRKKMAARERKRRERRKQAIIRCSILAAILILIVVGLVMLISGIVKGVQKKNKERQLSEYYATSEVTTEEPVAIIDDAIVAKEIPTDRDAALAILQEQAAEDNTIQSICDSAAAMPDILLQHLAVNPELKEFTLGYPAKINIVFNGEFAIDVDENEFPLYLQFDSSWGYADYSTDIIALRGAGPTALSMVYTYLMQDGTMNPIKVADYATEHGYLDEDGNTHWSLMTDGATALGLKSEEISVDKDEMLDALADDKILICKMSKGDFTTDEHFIVIHNYEDGFFYVKDPNSAARSEVGWDFKRLRGQIENICVLAPGSGTISNAASGDAASGDTTSNNTNTDTQTSNDDTTSNDTTPIE